MPDISPDPLPGRRMEVLGRRMAWTEIGQGPPILFQHGNPTSSYLWRNVMRPLADVGRCIAVDLIGMGGSEKLPDAGPMTYSLAVHSAFLEAAWAALVPDEPVVLVVHDWGGPLGFDWARRHPDRVRGVVYMETVVAPIPTWEDWPADARGIFQALRTEAGEAMILEKNVFVERILPAAILRELSPAERAIHGAPFATPGEGRRPTLDFPRQIPVAGSPPEVAALAQANADWLASADSPRKLFIDADPGSILTGAMRDLCRSWPNQAEARVRGSHFIQEDSPHAIAAAIRDWLPSLP